MADYFTPIDFNCLFKRVVHFGHVNKLKVQLEKDSYIVNLIYLYSILFFTKLKRSIFQDWTNS